MKYIAYKEKCQLVFPVFNLFLQKNSGNPFADKITIDKINFYIFLIHSTKQSDHLPYPALLKYRSRKALATTETELIAMAKPAIIGFNRCPVKGYKSPAAKGIPKVLYRKAQNKFCLMFFIVA